MKRTLLATLIAVTATYANAGVIVQYTFPGSVFSPTTAASNTTATAVNNTGSSARLEPGSLPANSMFLRQLVVSTTPATAVSNNQFFQFAVTPDAGFDLDLTGLAFDAAKGGPGTRGWVLRSSLDGFATDIATATIPTLGVFTPFAIDLSTSVFQDITSALTFRIYDFAPAINNAIFYDNLTLSGSVVETVPEPSTLGLLGLGVIGLSFAHRRKV